MGRRSNSSSVHTRRSLAWSGYFYLQNETFEVVTLSMFVRVQEFPVGFGMDGLISDALNSIWVGFYSFGAFALFIVTYNLIQDR